MSALDLTSPRSTAKPLLAALMIIGLLMAVCFSAAKVRTGGAFVYALDDAYIHLTLARSLAESGTWGLSAGEFAAASSSPLWTVTLAGFNRLGGPQALLPLFLNFVLSGVAVVLAAGLLRDFGAHGWGLCLCLVGFALATPLPALVAGGMEHVLQVCLCVAYLRLLLRALDEPAPKCTGSLLLWAGLSLLMPVTRYEDLFLIAAAAGVLAWRRRWLWAVMTVVPAVCSVSAFGLYFLAHGGSFLPNPLLIKGQTDILDALVHPDRLPTVLMRSAFAVTTEIHVFVLIGALLGMTLLRSAPARTRLCCLIVALAFLAHIVLAQTGWFYRYEAYLVGLSLLCLATALPWTVSGTTKAWRPAPAVIALVVYLGLPVAGRALNAFGAIPLACGNIHDQQVQMAGFVRSHYDRESVALHDIGAVSYETDARVLDLFGLACNEIARLKQQRRFGTADIDRLARERGVKMVIVYDSKFRNEMALPEHWVRVGTWTIADNLICAADTVSFYALDSPGTVRLRRSLEDYAKRLPPSVRVAYEPAPRPAADVALGRD